MFLTKPGAQWLMTDCLQTSVPFYVYLPDTGITGVYHNVQIFVWVVGMETFILLFP